MCHDTYYYFKLNFIFAKIIYAFIYLILGAEDPCIVSCMISFMYANGCLVSLKLKLVSL